VPVRKIPKNYLHVTGSFASRKNGKMGGFESPLEKDYMLLLDFDDMVEGFDEQPVRIPVPGVPKGYTPDVLVRMLPDPSTGEVPPSRLTEVKHTDDLKKNAKEYATKFALAERFAAERGWVFVIVTEKDIRTQRLANVKFLREYRNVNIDAMDCETVLATVREAGEIRYAELFDRLGNDDQTQLRMLPVLWHLVVTRRLAADLDSRFDGETMIWDAGDET